MPDLSLNALVANAAELAECVAEGEIGQAVEKCRYDDENGAALAVFVALSLPLDEARRFALQFAGF